MKNVCNIAICSPTTGMSPDAHWVSVTAVLAALNREKVPGYDNNGAFLLRERGSLIPALRYRLVKLAIEHKATHVLFIDTDQTFPAQIVHALARHKKPVVACNIATKSVPSLPTARSFNPNWWGGDKVYTTPQSKGLEQVWRVGTGIMLIETSVFEKIPKPYFDLRWMPEVDDFMGEDWFFCELCEKAGIPIYIDHDASRRVGHVGSFEYKHEHVEVEDAR